MPSNRCFCLGLFLLLPSIVLVILSWVFDNEIPEESDIDGEIGLFYQVGTCRNVNRSFQFTTASGGSQVWDAYTMIAVTPATPIGNACPLALEEPRTTVNIALEPTDGEGYGAGLPYSPVVMLPAGSYGMLAFDIVDLNGNTVLDITNLWLGPDDAYPWTVDGTNLSQAPDLFAGVGRRLLDGEVQPPGRKLLFAGLQSQRWTDDQAEEEEVSMATTHAPMGRRLLKGGTSSGTSSAGRSGSTGSSRWGSSSASVTTSTYGSRTTSTRVAVYSSATGRRYGGSPGPYYYRGYFFFYGFGPRYSYSRAPRALTGGAAFFVVRHDGYGCYTCPIRTCYACGSCTTRASCGAARTESLPADLDRYEIYIEPPLVLPAELPRWPLQLRLYNLTQYVQRTPSPSSTGSASNAFLTFYTDQTMEIPIGAIFAFIGWPCLVVAILILCIWRPRNQASYMAPPQMRPQSVEMTHLGAGGLAEMHDPPPQQMHSPPTGQAYNSQPMPAAQAYMMIVIPQGVAPGQSVEVQAPDGRRVRILVPAGMSPGMQLQVAIPAAPSPTHGQAQPVYGAAAAQPVYGAAAAQPVYGAAVAQPVYGAAVAQPVAMPAAYPAYPNNPHIAMFGAPYPSNPPSPPDGANRGKDD